MRKTEYEAYYTLVPKFQKYDNPYPISNQTELAVNVTAAIRRLYGDKITGLNVYERTDYDSPDYAQDIFIVIRRDWMWEVYHGNKFDLENPFDCDKIVDINGESRFIATIMKLYLTKLYSEIRIIGTEKTYRTYMAIAKRYIKKYRRAYRISALDSNCVGINGKSYFASSIYRSMSKRFFIPGIVKIFTTEETKDAKQTS